MSFKKIPEALSENLERNAGFRLDLKALITYFLLLSIIARTA